MHAPLASVAEAAALPWYAGETLCDFVRRLQLLVGSAGDLAGPPRYYVSKVSECVVRVDRAVGEEIARCSDLEAVLTVLGPRAELVRARPPIRIWEFPPPPYRL